MAIHIKQSHTVEKLSDTYTRFSVSLHSVPCLINSDGEANVSKYFKPYIRSYDEKDLRASFRGYPLRGCPVAVPSGYKGIVVCEKMQPLSEKADRNFHVIHTFDSLTYWNWDKTPSKSDSLLAALDWIEVSEAVHAPLDENNINSAA